jgi:surfeit locus 1 family protein
MNRLVTLLVATLLGLALLLSLGTWQLQRLASKEKLLADIAQNLAAPARVNPEGLAEYDKVAITGAFVGANHVLLLTTHQGGPAWSVVRPFKTEAGTVWLVDCGKTTDTSKPGSPPTGPITIEALAKALRSGGLFDATHAKAAQNFYWWDHATMAAHLGATEVKMRLTLLPGSPGSQGLHLDPPKADLRNNHLGYAITWFGLAAVLLVMSALFAKQFSPRRSQPTPPKV